MKRSPAPLSSTRIAAALALVLLATACGQTRSSGKPQPTPAGTPVRGPITAKIGPEGGTLATPDGRLTIQVPAGAVQAVTLLSIQEVTNTAPHGFGTAYQLEPSGTTFRKLVTITFDAKDTGTAIENVGIAYQDTTGYWTPLPSALRNRQARLITVQTPHFSGWALVPTNPSLDMSGSFTITSSLDLPFTAVGNANIGYAGEDANERYYLLSGTTALQPPVADNGAVCAPPAPDPVTGVNPNPASTYTFPQNLVEGFKLSSDPTAYSKLWWGTSAHWNLVCGANSTDLLEMAFDTVGINHLSCSRGYTAGTTPILTQDHLAGDYTIDCTGQPGGGTLRGTWDWVRCGGACQSTNPCATEASYTCTVSGPVCTVAKTATPGTSCTTATITAGVCNTAGTCIACSQNGDCTTTAQATNPCVGSASIDCSTGQEQCLAQTYKTAGTACTTSTVTGVCSPSTAPSAGNPGTPSTCVACSQGADCTSTLSSSNPCVQKAAIDCSSGAPVCTVQQYQNAGTTCTTSTGGPGACSPSALPSTGNPGTPSTCVACDPTAPCTVTNECAASTITDCSTGVPGCKILGYKDPGTQCGLVNGVYTGVCSSSTATPPNTCTACTPDADCSSQFASDPCVASAKIVCSSGSPVCTPTYKAPGADCGATPGTSYCSNTNPPVCTPCPTGSCMTDPCVASSQYVCSSGTPVCTPTYLAAGQSCGTGTSAGFCSTASPPVCVACTVGSACSPLATNPCVDPSATYTVTSCAAYPPTCSPNKFVADGTACGTGSFCLAGVCTSQCTTTNGTSPACVPTPNPCDVGTITCGTTTSCLDTGVSAAAGTICNAATGATCASCTTSSCTVGLACGTGACVQSTPATAAPDGSVCNPATGATCTAGQCCGSPCTTSTCAQGTITCSAGTATCVANTPATPAVDGSVCNVTTGATCTAGQCCGSSCVTAACTTGTITCSAGTATCVDTGTNTSVCAGTQTCNGSGVCQ